MYEAIGVVHEGIQERLSVQEGKDLQSGLEMDGFLVQEVQGRERDRSRHSVYLEECLDEPH